MLAWGQSVAESWQQITALDAGPSGQPRNAAEANALAVDHLRKQERALRTFLAAYPEDAKSFEARLRLIRLLEIRGGFEKSEKSMAEAGKMLAELDKAATAEQRVEVDFAKVTRLMRSARYSATTDRQQLLNAARSFHAHHPGDRRTAMLLAEVATLFDSQPKTKISLLQEANAATTDPNLRGRIADDLRRLDLLGQPLTLEAPSIQGGEVKLSQFLGRPVLIVFFADFSPPSTEAMTKVQRSVREIGRENVGVIGISLDQSRTALDSVVKGQAVDWPVIFDGKSWEGSLVRSLGINTLPTVWLVDREGYLRSLNALEGTTDQVRRLLKR